jgi:hypothetical protein
MKKLLICFNPFLGLSEVHGKWMVFLEIFLDLSRIHGKISTLKLFSDLP